MMTSSLAPRTAAVRRLFNLGAMALLFLVEGGCAHAPAPSPKVPKYSREQERARAGRWGGPEVNLAADAMAYAAGRSAEVGTWTHKLGRAPLVRVCPLEDATGEDSDAPNFGRSLAQSLTNGGHFEVAADEVPTAGIDGFVRSQLTSEPMQVEGQRATLYTLTVIVENPAKEPLWQRREVIRKWSAPSEAQPQPPELLPLVPAPRGPAAERK